jgi:hypothetical protein
VAATSAALRAERTASTKTPGGDYRDLRTIAPAVADLAVISAAWSGIAGGALVATLLALTGTLLSLAALWRLRSDYRVAEAAERSEAVRLSALVLKYVPVALRSRKTSEELPIVKQVIDLRLTRWKWLAIVLGALLLVSGTTAAYFTRRNLELLATVRPVVQAQANFDVSKTLPGVWGWRADFRQSCSENPQTITVSPDGKTVFLDYAKQFRSQLHYEFEVVSVRPNVIVLKSVQAPTATTSQPAVLTINFQDANSFLLTSSVQPAAAYGVIERCR